MTVHLRPEVQRRLEAIAGASGLSADAYLEALVEREVFSDIPDTEISTLDSGMVEENGLLIYRTDNPIPTSVIDDAIQRVRQEPSRQVLGDLS